ncbi:hypothetical protein I5M32_04140 [Pedobacter sp. SD-b]|uniref:Lipoprotein n=1 Tax=Pedobacter segetis TaxID=2793069 RepID=A0ABS1BGZ1_9SPHI|nr:hypothetical protein [Pedobacter segetis]MBK0382141.1 hypothetical protein [Pedobacter segetis]
MDLSKKIFLVPQLIFAAYIFSSCSGTDGKTANTTSLADTTKKEQQTIVKESLYKPVDSAKYFRLQKYLANGDTTGKWPVKDDILPINGAILPFNRIIAYYGNLYVKKMGPLGRYEPKEMWRKLDEEVAKWNKADTVIKSIPALHYIATVASGTPGKDGFYINRMPDSQIDSVLKIAKMYNHNAIVFLDVQVALSKLKDELPRLEKYLKMPNVHLGIDPEFSMKSGKKPGSQIGVYDAADINYASNFLVKLVKDNNLPCKILIVHRFTQKMVTNYKDIKLHKEVQLVMHMDGFGPPELKKGTYRHYLYSEPVQFVGFKLFYINDIAQAPNHLMTPEELLKLTPKPIYIQFQ